MVQASRGWGVGVSRMLMLEMGHTTIMSMTKGTPRRQGIHCEFTCRIVSSSGLRLTGTPASSAVSTMTCFGSCFQRLAQNVIGQ